MLGEYLPDWVIYRQIEINWNWREADNTNKTMDTEKNLLYFKIVVLLLFFLMGQAVQILPYFKNKFDSVELRKKQNYRMHGFSKKGQHKGYKSYYLVIIWSVFLTI